LQYKRSYVVYRLHLYKKISFMDIRFIDLFAWLWATRIGFEKACKELWLKSKCVFTSEIKPYAVKVYESNFTDHKVSWDITTINENDIPDFDYLLWWFPCQAFSVAWARRWFDDTRGTLFFDVARIIKAKKPKGFLLENVEWLVDHDKWETLSIILNVLTELWYQTKWWILNSKDFWVAQARKRIYIVWHIDKNIELPKWKKSNHICFWDIQEYWKDILEDDFCKLLLSHYSPNDLMWKSIKDKRWWDNNIHSWDIEYKWKTTIEQRELMSFLLKERRKKYWAEKKWMKRMDWIPLTLDDIYTTYWWWLFWDKKIILEMLEDLVQKWYLKKEHPKDIVISKDWKRETRSYREDLPIWYNIIAWKLSFPISKILDPKWFTPTIVATDSSKIWVIDGDWIRRLTVLEWKRLFWIPDEFIMDIPYSKCFDLLGNTVVVPVITEVSKWLLS